eukprot:15063460-Heterocapsa_arctica.AAC.1
MWAGRHWHSPVPPSSPLQRLDGPAPPPKRPAGPEGASPPPPALVVQHLHVVDHVVVGFHDPPRIRGPGRWGVRRR